MQVTCGMELPTRAGTSRPTTRAHPFRRGPPFRHSQSDKRLRHSGSCERGGVPTQENGGVIGDTAGWDGCVVRGAAEATPVPHETRRQRRKRERRERREWRGASERAAEDASGERMAADEA